MRYEGWLSHPSFTLLTLIYFIPFYEFTYRLMNLLGFLFSCHDIRNRYKEHATYHISKRHQSEIIPLSTDSNCFIPAIINKCKSKNRHISYTVLKSSGKERNDAPEYHDELACIGLTSKAAPHRKTHEEVAKHTSRKKCDR